MTFYVWVVTVGEAERFVAVCTTKDAGMEVASAYRLRHPGAMVVVAERPVLSSGVEWAAE